MYIEDQITIAWKIETHLFARFEDITLESIGAAVTGNVTKYF